LHGNGLKRAIPAAGAAFHTGIPIPDGNMLAVHFEHAMGANLQAHSATGAFFFIKFQGYDIFKVNQTTHPKLLSH
jgi:hypothetical protein